MSASTLWWLAAGIVVAAELATGTFYLLMIGLGLVAGAITAHFGLIAAAQIGVAAIVGSGATALWHFMRSSLPAAAPARSNRDVNLDIGARVHVAHWDNEQSAHVRYRGTGWTAHLQPGAVAAAGEHVIVAVEGNWLVLAPTSSLAQPSLSSR